MIDVLIRNVLLISLIWPAATSVSNYTCVPGSNLDAGVSLPRGDIFIKKGDSQQLECYLNPDHEYVTKDGYNSDHLVFKAKNRYLPVTKINKYAIKATYTGSEIEVDNVECMIRRDDNVKAICVQWVHVGYPPQNLVDFSCISEDWHSLNCTWSEPYNPIHTDYTVDFIEPGVNTVPKKCPTVSVPHEKLYLDEYRVKNGISSDHRNSPNYCYLDLTTNPPYRQTVKTYYFYINASNPLDPSGEVYSIEVDHYSVVRPGPVPAIRLTTNNAHQLSLQYNISLSLIEFQPGLKQRIRYWDEYDQNEREVDMTSFPLTQDAFSVSVSHLQPFTNYTFSVQMISALANQSDARLWSSPVYVSARTSAARPASSPRVNIGSFETLKSQSGRTVLVYWKILSPWERNGPNFTYTASLPHSSQIKYIDVDKSYAEFIDLTNKEQKVLITAENIKGSANRTSNIMIPQASFVDGLEPRAVTKVWIGEGRYRVAWRHPKRRDEVKSYTLFWCKDKNGRDRPYQCDGVLDWQQLKVDGRQGDAVQTHVLSLPEDDSSYQIAVSANTKHLSSGMFWTTCTVIQNRVESRLKKIRVEALTSTSVRVQWKLECSSQSGVVYGYRLDYCSKSGCKLRDISANREDYILHGLVPYTEYKIGVRIQNSNESYGESESEAVTTLPDRPGSPPRSFTATDVQSSSVKLSWLEPVVPNGEIGEYQIHYAYKEDHKEDSWTKQRTKLTNNTEFILDNLLSYTSYEVNITACTLLGSGNLACSNHAASIRFLTAIGQPARPPKPIPKFKNSTLVEIQWNRNFQLGAPSAESWHLKIQRSDKSSDSALISPSDIILRGNETRISLNLAKLLPDWSPDCQNSTNTNTFLFSVRAVVKDPSGEEFIGPWSPSAGADAYCTPGTNWFIFIGVPIIVLTVSFLFMCLMRSVFKYWHDTTQFFGEVAKDLDAKLVLPSDNPGEPVNVTEFEMTPMDNNSGHGNSGSESKDDDSDTLLLEDANNGGHGGKPFRQKSESESAASCLTSGCDSFLSRGLSDCSHQLNKQVSSNCSMPDHGSTCSGYVSMTRTESNGSNGGASSTQLAPMSSSSRHNSGSRNNSGTNRPVSAGPTLPTVTSSSLLSDLVQSPLALDKGLLDSNRPTLTPLSAGLNDDTRSVMKQACPSPSPMINTLQESKTSPGYSLVMSINSQSNPTSSGTMCNNFPYETKAPSLVLDDQRDGTNVSQIKLPAFTPPPDSMLPLVGTVGMQSGNKTMPASCQSTGPENQHFFVTSGAGYTNTAAALYDETSNIGSSMLNSIPGFLASPRAESSPESKLHLGSHIYSNREMFLGDQGSLVTEPGSDNAGLTGDDPVAKQINSDRQRHINNFPKHSYISVQQVQELKPNPNHSAYTRIETCLESGGKAPESEILDGSVVQ